MYLNYLGNYVPNAWNYEHGCGHCHQDVIDLSQLEVSSADFAVGTVSVVERAFAHVSGIEVGGWRGGVVALVGCGAGFGFWGFQKVVFRGLSGSLLPSHTGSYATYYGMYAGISIFFFPRSAEAVKAQGGRKRKSSQPDWR